MQVMADDTTYERKVRAGKWLREAREERQLKANELAEMLGVTPATMSTYELGKSTVPDKVAADLAGVFGLSEVEVRHNLGLYVPGDYVPQTGPTAEIDTLAAIQRDARLIPEARKHLLNQYKLLLRIQNGSDEESEKDQDTEAEVLDMPKVARKRAPKKRPT